MQITGTFSTEIHKICIDYRYWISSPELLLDKSSWVWVECTSNDPEEQRRLDEGGFYKEITVPTDFTRVTFRSFLVDKPIKSEDLQAIANRYEGKIMLLESDQEYEEEIDCEEGALDWKYNSWYAHLRFKSSSDRDKAAFNICKLFEIKPADFFADVPRYMWYPHAPEELSRLALKELRNLQNLQTEWASY